MIYSKIMDKMTSKQIINYLKYHDKYIYEIKF